MGPTDYPETSVRIYDARMCKISKERRSQKGQFVLKPICISSSVSNVFVPNFDIYIQENTLLQKKLKTRRKFYAVRKSVYF